VSSVDYLKGTSGMVFVGIVIHAAYHGK